jgi:CarD family transcriptional regulator
LVGKEEAMQFSIGDKVIHPKFGAGEITGEEHRELVKGFRHYFVIKILAAQGTAYVPVHKMIELGVRPVMSQAKLALVLDTLRSAPRWLSKDFKERQKLIQEMLETGYPIPIAEAIRDLTCHGQSKRLTEKDQQLLKWGRGLLATEIAVVTDTQVFDAEMAISTALKVAILNNLPSLSPKSA